MKNTIARNPRNKVGRNSGAGRGGLDMYVPTPEESKRGLRPFEEPTSPWPMRIGVGIGFLGMVSGGIVALAMRRAERKRTVRGRLEKLVPWR
jgi:hypothetical protein